MNCSLLTRIQLILICIHHGGDGIRYGEEAEIGDFTYYAKIYLSESNELVHCGGVVIDEFHILTAAHCVSKIRPNKILISLGSNQITKASQFWAVDQIHVHQNFKPLKTPSCINIVVELFLPCISGPIEENALAENDIAVLKTIELIPLGGSITKLDLPESDSLPFCEVLRYAGWGSDEESLVPNRLQWTRVLIITQEECIRYYFLLREEQFCAITADSISSIAPGDSGSPLVYENIVYGITSFSWDDSPNQPTGFTKVFSHKDFIENATKLERFKR